MNPENAIEVKDVHKYFKVYDDKGKMLRERIIHWNRNHYEKREVLKGISFNVKKGEAIGLIGTNGCGKSTTLKLLTRILRPNDGSIEIDGKIYSMIELGAGFHPDMSGRENIYINASIYGVKAKEVDKRLDDIVAFSELEDFIDNPVRTYSSGMYMRLAFAIAINMDADVLLIDEILAVGDSNFQDKCFNKLREIKANGTTIVIVSHSLAQIEQICDRTIWIKDGKIKLDGNPRDVHPAYMEYMGIKKQEVYDKAEKAKKEDANKEDQDEYKDKNRWGNQKAVITNVSLLNDKSEKINVLKVGQKAKLRVDYKVNENIENAIFGFGLFRVDRIQCYGTNTNIDKKEKFNLNKDGFFEIELNSVNLITGQYYIDVSIEEGYDGVPVDFYRKALEFQMYSDMQDVGITRIPHSWNYTV